MIAIISYNSKISWIEHEVVLTNQFQDDIETLIAQFHAKDQEKTKYVEEKCDPPSER